MVDSSVGAVPEATVAGMRVRSATRGLRVAGLVIFFVVMLVAAPACGDDSSSDATNTTTGNRVTTTTFGLFDLSRQTFVSTEVTGHQLVSGTTVTLEFPNGAELSAKAGCNSMGGNFSVERGVLIVEGMRSTLIGCSPELQAQDDWVSSFLSSKPKVASDGQNLRLTGPDASIAFEAVKTD